MGCPSTYYKTALQCLAHAITYDEDYKLAKEWRKEASEEKLEAYILEQKSKLPESKFYYYAGRATECAFLKANKDGCDAVNASIAGIGAFESFIGIDDEDMEE